MSCFRNEVLIRRRIRGRQPVFDVLLRLITYKIPLVSATEGAGNNKRFISFISFDAG